jgi:ABC-type bacteriocin/lantibiotic exporter with double-glycine peptidase domain
MTQTNMLTKLIQWLRREFFEHLIHINNENMMQNNIMSYSSPINRLSYTTYAVISNVLNFLITNVAFLILISGYFMYKSRKLGTVFLFANILIFLYIYWNWEYMVQKRVEVEETMNANESVILDIFNNFDKIIYRGEGANEVKNYKERADDCVEKTVQFYNMTNRHTILLMAIIYLILFFSILYLIAMHQKKEIDNKIFITFFTIVLLYRERMSALIQLIPNYLEFNARNTALLEKIKDIDTAENTVSIGGTLYKTLNLKFEKIEFKNVSFKYASNQEYVLKNYSLTLRPDNNIIGLTGISGRGKSTVMKLLIKLYSPEEGDILIDNINIKTIDTEYLRKNITYVNQNSRLFDRKVIDNIMYGCTNPSKCDSHLKFILKYKKIQQLFQGIDFKQKQAGALGENLSGGQRQIVNIISGLINPSKILILDEPTNALDPELKKEIIQIVKEFKKYKKGILIISHDRDVFSIFDENIKL